MSELCFELYLMFSRAADVHCCPGTFWDGIKLGTRKGWIYYMAPPLSARSVLRPVDPQEDVRVGREWSEFGGKHWGDWRQTLS